MNVITNDGLIEESVTTLQSRLLLHCETKGSEVIYLGEQDEMHLPLSVVYDGDSSIYVATNITKKGSQLQVIDSKDVMVMPHTGTQISLVMRVGLS